MIDGTYKTGVLKASKKVLYGIRKKMGGTIMIKRCQILQTRYVRSWPVFKVYTGSVNFYEEKTALVLLDFNITQVVNLLMM